MNDRLAYYVRSQLLGAGFSIIDADIAFKLSCGLWSSPTNVATDFADKQGIISRFGGGCSVLSAEIEGQSVVILARSTKGLKARIEMLTGLKVGGITEHVAEEARPLPVVPKIAPVVEERITRQLRKDYNRQAAEHADFERRKQALAKGEQHRQWLEQRRVDAENSRQEFYSKRNGNGG